MASTASPSVAIPGRIKEKLPPTPPLSNGAKDRRHDPLQVPPKLSWLDESCIQDIEHFAKTLVGIKSKGSLRPDHLGSILSQYTNRWLPELSGRSPVAGTALSPPPGPSPESPTAAWLKKRFFLEALVAVLPPERGAMPCDLLLRLLRAACMVGVDPACLQELEARAGAQLEEASLKELMIPAFSHKSGTLLDVGLVLRLVRRFLGAEGEVASARSGASFSTVARLLDSYLAEVALDGGLGVAEFEELARVLPSHARTIDDGLYRAIDTYIKVHPNANKQEKKSLCRIIDARKLTAEASLHAVHNERLPVRSVIQVLFSEHTKVNRFTDWSGSFNGARSPSPVLEPPGRCPSKREVLAQQQEMRKLKDEVARLQIQCHALQTQLDKIVIEKKKKKGLFRWSSFLSRSADSVSKVEDYDFAMERPTPMHAGKERMPQGRGTRTMFRNSMS